MYDPQFCVGTHMKRPDLEYLQNSLADSSEILRKNYKSGHIKSDLLNLSLGKSIRLEKFRDVLS